jgi:hypothetical protein
MGKRTWIAYAVYRIVVQRIRMYDLAGVSESGIGVALQMRGLKPFEGIR